MGKAALPTFKTTTTSGLYKNCKLSVPCKLIVLLYLPSETIEYCCTKVAQNRKNARGKIRTRDLFVRSETLYPAGLHAHVISIKFSIFNRRNFWFVAKHSIQLSYKRLFIVLDYCFTFRNNSLRFVFHKTVVFVLCYFEFRLCFTRRRFREFYHSMIILKTQYFCKLIFYIYFIKVYSHFYLIL